VCEILRNVAVRHGWRVASYGTDLPATLVKPELAANLHNTRPDIVLYNDFARYSAKVVLVEVTVTFDTDRNINAARIHKLAVYRPLIEAIKLSHPYSALAVDIAPAVVGARGIIHNRWHEDLKPLGLNEGQATKAGCEVSLAVIKASHWIWTLWAAQAHGNPGNDHR